MISTAFAQTPGGGGGFDVISLMPLVLIFVVFYFLLIRPQQKKLKQHRSMISSLRRGDSVVTGGGLIGKVTKVYEGECVVEVADGVRVRVISSTIADVRAKTEPAKGGKGGKDD